MGLGVVEGGLGRAQVQEGPQRGAGLPLGAGLEPAAQQQERGDDRGRLEVQAVVGHLRHGPAHVGGHVRRQDQLHGREGEGDEHAQGHEGVHRGRAVPGRAERRRVERPRRPQRHGRRQGERDPAPVRELQRRDHGDQHERHRQHRRADQARCEHVLTRTVGHVVVVVHAVMVRGMLLAVLLAVLGGVRVPGVSGVSGRRGGTAHGGAVPGLLDGGHELLVRHAGGRGDGRLFERQVHGRRDALELAQLALDAAHARGAGHAGDVQVDAAGGLGLRAGRGGGGGVGHGVRPPPACSRPPRRRRARRRGRGGPRR
ncbi:Uncharacterised protein [Streptococcus pneumoniae]|nr:Uncharacterised protein [Streptococcus pneumoniae]